MRFAGRFSRYAALCGARRAVRCLLAERRGRTGLLAVNDPFLEGPLWLRIGSTDINVAGKILLEREYELPLSRDPRVIVDAGAYTGISSRWFAARYPNATIVALEPGAANFELLRRNIRQETRIVSVREALWCKDELVSMTEEAGDGAWALRVAHHGSAEPVRATTVTTLMQRLGLDRIDLLKLDIEGSEVEVFQSGAQDWLPYVEAIAVETHDRFRTGSRAAVLQACVDFAAREVGSETVFLERPRPRP